MARYRKKPIEVEAIQWFAKQWFSNRDIYHAGVWCDHEGSEAGKPYVITIHNQRAYLADGDWIIAEPKAGFFYLCKPDIFAATYEEVL